jgi:hypothetical protein
MDFTDPPLLRIRAQRSAVPIRKSSMPVVIVIVVVVVIVIVIVIVIVVIATTVPFVIVIVIVILVLCYFVVLGIQALQACEEVFQMVPGDALHLLQATIDVLFDVVEAFVDALFKPTQTLVHVPADLTQVMINVFPLLFSLMFDVVAEFTEMVLHTLQALLDFFQPSIHFSCPTLHVLSENLVHATVAVFRAPSIVIATTVVTRITGGTLAQGFAGPFAQAIRQIVHSSCVQVLDRLLHMHLSLVTRLARVRARASACILANVAPLGSRRLIAVTATVTVTATALVPLVLLPCRCVSLLPQLTIFTWLCSFPFLLILFALILRAFGVLLFRRILVFVGEGWEACQCASEAVGDQFTCKD